MMNSRLYIMFFVSVNRFQIWDTHSNGVCSQLQRLYFYVEYVLTKYCAPVLSGCFRENNGTTAWFGCLLVKLKRRWLHFR